MKRSSRPKVLIQYMSDLHQERQKYSFAVAPAAPTMILAGDIGRFCDYDQFRELLSRFCSQHELVLLIAGNHEFYGSSRAKGLDAAARLVNEPSMGGRLRFLNRDRIDLNSNVTVLGCTLHSHIAPGYMRLTNDFARISEWSVKAHNEEHSKDFQWLQTSLQQLRTAEPHRTIVIATHYAPVFEGVCHPHNEPNDVSQCFSSTAMADLRKAGALQSVSHWIFGHTHWNAKIKLGNLVLLSNQMYSEDKDLSWWQRKRLHVPFKPEARLTIAMSSMES